MGSFPTGQSLELKLARRADARRIALMSRDLVEAGLPWSWTPQRVAHAIREPETAVLTAWTQGQLAGFAIMQFYAERAHLNLLAVDPAYRRLGVGGRLIAWLEKTARTGGLFFINLEVRAKNSTAQAFYRRLGYRASKSIPGYYTGRETAVCMQHDLRLRRPLAP
jgi:ribosomal protein S18 acetylase RimI-like enzyme